MTVAEPMWELKRFKYDKAMQQFQDMLISEHVLRALLHGLGYRNQELDAEVRLAEMQREEKSYGKAKQA